MIPRGHPIRAILLVIIIGILTNCSYYSAIREDILVSKAERIAKVGDEEAANFLINAANEELKNHNPDSEYLLTCFVSAGQYFAHAGLYHNSINSYKSTLKYIKDDPDLQAVAYFRIAQNYSEISDYKSAINNYRKSIQLSQYDADDLSKQLFIAQMYYDSGEIDSCDLEINNLFEENVSFNNIDMTRELLVHASSLYSLRYEIDKAKFYADSLCVLAGDTISYQINATNNMAQIFRMVGAFDSSIVYKKKVMKLMHEDGMPKDIELLYDIGEMHFNLASEHNVKDDLALAEVHALNMVEIFGTLGDAHQLFLGNSTLLDIYIQSNQQQKASIFQQKLLDILPQITDPYGLLSGYGSLMSYYSSIGDTRKQLEYLLKEVVIIEDIARTDDAFDPSIGANLHFIAGGLYRRHGKLDSANIHFRKSEEYANAIADSSIQCRLMIDFADIAQKNGEIEIAYDQLQNSLRVALTISDTILIPIIYHALGNHFMNLGLFWKAEESYKKAIELNPFEPLALNNLGIVYAAWGKYDRALAVYQEAMKLSQGAEDQLYVINNIGNYYEQLRQPSRALEYYNQAFSMATVQGREYEKQTILINLARTSAADGDTSSALRYLNEYETSIELIRPDPISYVHALTLAGDLNLDDLNFAEAKKRYLKALSISEDNKYSPGSIESLINLGKYHFVFSVYNDFAGIDSSDYYYNRALHEIENIRLTADYSTRREFLSKMITAYEDLIYINHYTGNKIGILESMDRCRAKVLQDRLFREESENSAVPASSIQSLLKPAQAIIQYSITRDYGLISLLITKDSLYSDSYRYLDNNFGGEQASVYDYCAVKVKLCRASASNSHSSISISPYNNDLYNMLVSPFEKQLSDKSMVTIIPDKFLALLPFELLMDDRGDFLSENHNISYAQSVKIWASKQERKDVPNTTRIFAVGGVSYDDMPTVGVDENYEDGNTISPQFAYGAITSLSQGRSMTSSYSQLGYGALRNIPGSMAEVEMIKDIFKSTDLLTGADATEEAIKKLSENGDLKKYSIIHFATHGLAVSDLPELSAVVLANSRKEDGYLAMPEVARLELGKSDVILSACETGVGKIFPGEGVIGLADAFTVAGAKSVTVSLWPIDDIASSIFMTQVYQQISAGESVKSAISTTKRSFIDGDKGEEYKNPYYWAPFVYYGN